MYGSKFNLVLLFFCFSCCSEFQRRQDAAHLFLSIAFRLFLLPVYVQEDIVGSRCAHLIQPTIITVNNAVYKLLIFNLQPSSAKKPPNLLLLVWDIL